MNTHHTEENNTIINPIKSVEPKRIGLILLTIAILFSLIPFFAIKYVPATDLPQHLSQVRMFYDLFSSPPQTTYSISYFSGNILVYWILALLWLIFPPLIVGKIFMMGVVVLWILAIYLIAWKTERSFISATLAATLAFNASLYWGLINFLIGFPLFSLWYTFVVYPSESKTNWQQLTIILVMSFLLFLAHALWLVVAILALLIIDLRRKTSWKSILFHIIGIVPVLLTAAIWFPEIAASRTTLRFDTDPHWIVSPLERLHPQWIVNSLYGGLRNPIEWFLLVALSVWIFLSIYTNRHKLKKKINWDLFTIAILFLCLVYFAPEKYINTYFFASRWYPIALVLLLLSLPAPKLSEIIQISYSLLFFIMLSIVTTIVWRMFETYENSGLDKAIEPIPQKSKVLGLDLTKQSILLNGRPFMQSFAYANVLNGAEINFSFALHQSGIVRTIDKIPTQKWTHGLEWMAEWVRFEDFEYFDYALINAPDPLHNILMFHKVFKPITLDGNWRLYKCEKNTGLKGQMFKPK